MQKKLASIIFSTRLTATLFIVFAIAMAVGTLVDASSETSPTPYSRALIYNAWWFEAIMGLFVVNFLGNIVRFKMFSKEKKISIKNFPHGNERLSYCCCDHLVLYVPLRLLNN